MAIIREISYPAQVIASFDSCKVDFLLNDVSCLLMLSSNVAAYASLAALAIVAYFVVFAWLFSQCLFMFDSLKTATVAKHIKH